MAATNTIFLVSEIGSSMDLKHQFSWTTKTEFNRTLDMSRRRWYPNWLVSLHLPFQNDRHLGDNIPIKISYICVNVSFFLHLAIHLNINWNHGKKTKTSQQLVLLQMGWCKTALPSDPEVAHIPALLPLFCVAPPTMVPTFMWSSFTCIMLAV